MPSTGGGGGFRQRLSARTGNRRTASRKTNSRERARHRPASLVLSLARTAADARKPPTATMGDIPPCPTIYVNNLNEKIKKEGARGPPSIEP